MNDDRVAPGMLSRRRFLRLGLAGGTALLAGCGRGSMMGNRTVPGFPADSPGGDPLLEPAVMASRDGLLEVELVAAPVELPWGTKRRWGLAYNGTVPGPTLRVRAGDRMRVRLVNRLDEPTNLHTHGLHVSPSDASDDPFVMVEPGGSHDYDYRIPADHPGATCWYHPHHHGRVAPQLAAGLAGVLVVDDARTPPWLTGLPERVLVLSDPRIGSTRSILEATGNDAMTGRFGDGALVNGQRAPVLQVGDGGVERWRIVNASASRVYRLRLDGSSWWQVAGDGSLLASVAAVGEVPLAPGERVELVVAATSTGGTLLAEPVRSGAGMMGVATPREPLLRAIAARNSTFEPPAGALGTVDRLAAVTVDRSRRLALGMSMGMGGGDRFTIDGRRFDPARIDLTGRLDTVEEWVIENDTMMDHPFHLHVWPFQVVERSDGVTPPLGWKDVVDVPAGGWVRLRVRFADFGGRTVYHCHIPDHADRGMMGVIEVR